LRLEHEVQSAKPAGKEIATAQTYGHVAQAANAAYNRVVTDQPRAIGADLDYHF
jgi:hypothetical protein